MERVKNSFDLLVHEQTGVLDFLTFAGITTSIVVSVVNALNNINNNNNNNNNNDNNNNNNNDNDNMFMITVSNTNNRRRSFESAVVTFSCFQNSINCWQFFKKFLTFVLNYLEV